MMAGSVALRASKRNLKHVSSTTFLEEPFYNSYCEITSLNNRELLVHQMS